MMVIFQHVLAVGELRRICALPAYTLHTAAGTRRIRNHNKLLGVYSGMGPAKTGWTIASRHTYAASATRNGRELLLVLLKSPNKWNDARAIFDYGFSLGEPAGSPPAVASPAAPAPAPRGSASYTVQRGDTLSAIARRHGVSVASLVETNRLTDPDQLQPGTRILIP
jgi:D-alanyl-D-alanine carboxypeptidase